MIIKKRFTAAIMAFVMVFVVTLGKAAPASATDKKKEGSTLYISEVKIGMGETEDEAKKELEAEGYTILKDEKGKLADLNVDAGSNSALKEGANDKIVYLGYKTTDNAYDAITDLAVMNMKGGYSLEDYNILMQQTMDSQIKPFVENFVATLDEYRENYKKPEASLNHIRADYMRRSMNMMIDDDTGKPMGDLLLNKTKYELGDEAYNKLSDDEKKNHCDILTLLMQANGQATMVLKKLVSRASDTSKKTWIDRFKKTTLDDLIEDIQDEDESLSTKKDVMDALDRKYGDKANLILNKWEEFRSQIVDYEEKMENLQDSNEETKEALESSEKTDPEEISDEDLEAKTDAQVEVTSQAYDAEIVGVCVYMETVKYGDDSMYEFFSRDFDEVSTKEGKRSLYPIIASLSAGQEAGLDFLSIVELFSMALSDETAYKNAESELKNIDPASVYEGVNREIYEKGGVALTSKSLRAKALGNEQSAEYKMGTLPIVFWGVTAGFAAASITSSIVFAASKKFVKTVSYVEKFLEPTVISYEGVARVDMMKSLFDDLANDVNTMDSFRAYLNNSGFSSAQKEIAKETVEKLEGRIQETLGQIAELENNGTITHTESVMKKVVTKTQVYNQVAKYLAVGMAVVTLIMTIVSTTLTLLDAKKFYDIDFDPIPKYMVDEADITTSNEKGDKEMIKNETAYYRVVECNRTEGDSDVTKKNFKAMGTRNDLNGDIGKEWLSLYAVKYLGGAPILADSLLYRKDSDTVPNGYSTGIHDFGNMAACNLNNAKFLFPDKTPSIKVFYKIDTKTIKELTATGSLFGVGYTILSGGVGLLAGILIGALFMGRRKKENIAKS